MCALAKAEPESAISWKNNSRSDAYLSPSLSLFRLNSLTKVDYM